jgi:H+/Cl- antiporter ClcA
MPAGQRIALVAAGAGAGIAATFNTPIGGVMFAIELMMPEVSVETFLPVAIATGTATFVGRWFFGDTPAFHVPPLQAMAVDSNALVVLILFAVLGALSGVAAAGFIKGLHLAEDLFDRIKSRYFRHILGMLIVGVLMYTLLRIFGPYKSMGLVMQRFRPCWRDRSRPFGCSHSLAFAKRLQRRSVLDRAHREVSFRLRCIWGPPSVARLPHSGTRPACQFS